jgi:ATP-dependent RNA helicase RhlB
VTEQQPFSDISFTSLHLPEALARGIADAGFERCTPIQAGALPRALAGLDVAGQAQTGTGKTAAFLVALYSRLMRNQPAAGRPVTSPRALILAPTRELAIQIHHDAEILGQYTGLGLGLAYGGVDYEKQRRRLEEGVDILIGTPGRLIDYFKQHVYDLRHVEVLVLDEADRMFDLGFIKDIRYLLRRLPAPDQRLNLLFSATLSQRVLELAYEHMNDPELIRIEPERITADKVRQAIYFPSMEEKAPLLIHLLRKMGATRSMVFVNTKRVAEYLERKLRANGLEAAAMSGDVPQARRMRMLRDFHDGKIAVLVATDVAARGLHIPDVSHVFNYDLPQDPEDYVHRIGRTARAGASGDAVSLGCEEYVVTLPEIEAFIGRKLPVEHFDPHELPEVSSASNVPRHKDTQSWKQYEERRAGGGSRGGGSRGGGSRSSGSRGGGGTGSGRPRRPAAPPAAKAPPPPAAAATDAQAPGEPSPAKKRRRRRRRSGGPAQDPGGAPPPAAAD